MRNGNSQKIYYHKQVLSGQGIHFALQFFFTACWFAVIYITYQQKLQFPTLLILHGLMITAIELSWISRERKSKMLQKIQQLQYEHHTQLLYRFVEFGKLSAGLFHDLMNILMGVTASVSELRLSNPQTVAAKESVTKAIAASNRMSEYFSIIRKQLSVDDTPQVFIANNEIRSVIDILHYRIRQTNTIIDFRENATITLHGYALRFYQVILNLVSNALDAIQEQENHQQEQPHIIIETQRDEMIAIISVQDNGIGIPKAFLKDIFKPFFSTKNTSGGIGLGLSHSKHIIETYFNGTLTVSSAEERGSVFTIQIPIQ